MIIEKREITLPLSEVVALDKYLREKWQIVLSPDSGDKWEEITYRKVGAANYCRVGELNKGRTEHQNGNAELERAFYSLVSKEPFGTWMQSPRRAIILDGTALVDGLLTELGDKAAVLEVGCGAGYSAAWLAKKHSASIVGIDFSEESLESNRMRLTKHGNLTLKCHDVCREELGQQFDLIFSLDGMPIKADEFERAVEWCGRHLRPGGRLVLVSVAMEWAQNEAVRWGNFERILAAAQLGFLFLEPIGGWVGGGQGWMTKTAMVWRKGGTGILPTDIKARVDMVWSGFANYANVPGRPMEQKTLAYYLANQTQT